MRKVLLGICLVLALEAGAWAHGPDLAKVDVLVKSTSSWDGRDLPQYPTGAPEITVLKITIPPRVQLPLHKHPVINAGILLKAELTVITENKETLHLKVGDAIIEVVEKWHFGLNEGDEPAEIIVFYSRGQSGQHQEIEMKTEPANFRFVSGGAHIRSLGLRGREGD